MALFKLEQGSERWFGVTVILLSLMLIASSLGKTNWLAYISGGFSIILGLFLYREGGVRDYLQKKGYKKITAGDFIVWSSFIFGTFLLTNGLLLFFGDLSGGFVNFIRSSGVVGGIISLILGTFLILTPKVKA